MNVHGFVVINIGFETFINRNQKHGRSYFVAIENAKTGTGNDEDPRKKKIFKILDMNFTPIKKHEIEF